MKRLITLLLLVFTAWQGTAQAQLTIEITGGAEGAEPIAVVPFGKPDGVPLAEDVAAIIAANLARTGRFKPMPRGDMVATPSSVDQVDLNDWRRLAMDNLVVGQVRPRSGGGYDVDFVLFDVFRGEQLANMTLASAGADLRFTAHRISDIIYQRLTGSPGVFATRIAYVTADRATAGGERVALRVSDSDGYNPQTIVASREPILSPAWSPDGRRLAYVSFENKQAAVYIQELASGRRERVAAHKGLNGSPAWSPDGTRLALTLSMGGNPDIYVLDLNTRALTQITDHFAIDTEPAWSPDGNHLLFTSGRGGNPQIYRVAASGGAAERVTFENDYNARASYAPDGRSILMVTRVNGRFRIGLLDLTTRSLRLLSDGGLDETPSFAPNGSMIIYATQYAGRGVLAAVSVDGSVSQRLSQDLGDVREPAWSPLVR
ncbi:MAG: Tol-Pal system beta propeller repeat protein TolB [Chromatiaceae bacterium]|jgi:TolB protein|nr:Tol-Pal system beta propeller repeat protein TolB [Chromatiaceae bacterium]